MTNFGEKLENLRGGGLFEVGAYSNKYSTGQRRSFPLLNKLIQGVAVNSKAIYKVIISQSL